MIFYLMINVLLVKLLSQSQVMVVQKIGKYTLNFAMKKQYTSLI